MKQFINIVVLFAILFLSSGCSNTPSSSMKKEQYEVIDQNVKKILGENYSAVNFTVVEEGYTAKEEDEYMVKFIFDLNKPYLIFSKQIPGQLMFKKSEKEWQCTLNTGNALGLFNIIQ